MLALAMFTTLATAKESPVETAALPPLAGVPYAVKNLFDVQGLTTLAGSRINRDRPPARRDAVLVARMRAAGADLLGALNMDEYACGFTTENTHYGLTRNPHDPSRTAGGSAAAVAGGYFEENAEPAALDAVASVARALGASGRIDVPEAARARAAAFVITASEGGNLHLPDLKQRACDFDPLTRERFLAGVRALTNATG